MAELNDCSLCPIAASWCNSRSYGYVNQDILVAYGKFSVRAACKLQDFYYVIYNNDSIYAYHKHFKTLHETIDDLIIRLNTLSLEEILQLTKFKRDVERYNME